MRAIEERATRDGWRRCSSRRRSPSRSCAGRSTSSSSRTRRTSRSSSDRDVLGQPVRRGAARARGAGDLRAARQRRTQSGQPLRRPVACRSGWHAPPADRWRMRTSTSSTSRCVDDSGAVDGIAVVAFEVTALATARHATPRTRTARRTSSSRCSATSCAIRSRRSSPRCSCCGCAASRRRERERDDHRAAGAPPGRPRRRPARRLAHHARQDRADARAGRARRGRRQARSRSASPLLEQRQHDLDVDVAAQGSSSTPIRRGSRRSSRNLLTNAAKYTPAGGRIRIDRAPRDGGDVVLRVRDNGIGIDAGHAAARSSTCSRRTARRSIARRAGLGLGLAIVRSLVALHGGTVTAHSDGRGRGSEFVVRLPRRRGVRRGDRSRRGRAGGGRPRVRGRARARRRRQRGRRRDAGRGALGAAATTPRIAHDGPIRAADRRDVRARHRAARHRAAGDGRLRARAPAPRARRARAMRLVAVTGLRAGARPRGAPRDAGFDAHLVKPVDLDEVIRLVQEFSGGPRSAS